MWWAGILGDLDLARALTYDPAAWGDFQSTTDLLTHKALASKVILAVDAPHLFGRAGNPYLASNGTDWPDNAFRFAALGRAAADIGRGLVSGIE